MLLATMIQTLSLQVADEGTQRLSARIGQKVSQDDLAQDSRSNDALGANNIVDITKLRSHSQGDAGLFCGLEHSLRALEVGA